MFLKINNQVFVKREKSHRAADLMMTQMLQSLWRHTEQRENTGRQKTSFPKD